MNIELQFIKNTPKKKQIASLLLGVFVFGSVFGSVGLLRAKEGGLKKKKEELRDKMENLQSDITSYQKQIKKVRTKEANIEEELSMYESKIKKLKLQIERLNLSIRKTNEELKAQQERLEEIKEGITVEKKLLGAYVEKTRRHDQASMISLVFGDNDLSSFFDRMREVSRFRGAIMGNLKEIKKKRKKLAQEKEKLDAKRSELYDMKNLQEIQKRTLAQQKQNRKKLLAEAKENKRTFLSIAEEKKDKLEQVKRELFELEDLGVSMKFKEALDKARFASKKTGVRPALLLAMMKKESQWGENLGDGNWRTDMNPAQREAYLKITEKLGVEPDSKPVSARPSSYQGWGGAMGPAQFMPKTWLGYADQVAQLTGNRPPSPWRMQDALVALALKLKKAGAANSNYKIERRAVLKFFAGSYWNNPAYSFYGDAVMNYAQKYQRKVDILEQQNS